MSEDNPIILERLAALEAKVETLDNKVSSIEKLLYKLVSNQSATIRWVIISLVIIVGAMLGIKIAPPG